MSPRKTASTGYRIGVEDNAGVKHFYTCETNSDVFYLVNRFERSEDAYSVTTAGKFPASMIPSDFGWVNARFQYWLRRTE